MENRCFWFTRQYNYNIIPAYSFMFYWLSLIRRLCCIFSNICLTNTSFSSKKKTNIRISVDLRTAIKHQYLISECRIWPKPTVDQEMGLPSRIRWNLNRVFFVRLMNHLSIFLHSRLLLLNIGFSRWRFANNSLMEPFMN